MRMPQMPTGSTHEKQRKEASTMAEVESDETQNGGLLNIDLTALPGVIVFQDGKIAQTVMRSFDLPYQARNVYLVKKLPDDIKIAAERTDPDIWYVR